MDIEIDPGLPPVTSKIFTIPLKPSRVSQKELKDLDKMGLFQRSLSPYASPIVIVPRKSKIWTKWDFFKEVFPLMLHLL